MYTCMFSKGTNMDLEVGIYKKGACEEENLPAKRQNKMGGEDHGRGRMKERCKATANSTEIERSAASTGNMGYGPIFLCLLVCCCVN